MLCLLVCGHFFLIEGKKMSAKQNLEEEERQKLSALWKETKIDVLYSV
jgi:hypothetical protein